MHTYKSSFQAIGTNWKISAELLDDNLRAKLNSLIKDRIEEFDKNYSRFRADSLVSKMAKKAGKFKLPKDGYKLLQFYESLYKITKGKFTPLIGQAISDAGYDKTYSFHKKPMKRPPKWQEVLSYSSNHIEVYQPALLDFGAAGKGYLIDIVGDILDKNGCTEYTIDAGGDILHHSASGKKFKVGLENPADPTEVVAIAEISNMSLCASSGNKRKWLNFNHIIDPEKLLSPNDILASWVVAKETMTADGLATALFFTDPLALSAKFNFAFAMLDQNMALTYSNNFPMKIFQKA